MKAENVLNVYNLLRDAGITIWIDGGWCVDALLGRQSRDHTDLDIAVSRKHADRLKQLLGSEGYCEKVGSDSSAWNYILVNEVDGQIDVHVFDFDEHGNNIYGIEYPKASLSGKGTINGQEVDCIAAEWMFKFKTAYKPKQKDLQDVTALAEKFGYSAPDSHRLA
jgi:lincosamide nucleotidyltransferase A/C/D/E